MRDAKCAPPPRRVVQRVLHFALSLTVQGGGRLIEYQHARLP